ncbi:ABC transporter substrate-binding protein [Paenibacillus periandrae]|uniref:ABC transporter substrate-binding protein n=1 Tax=Paenibacillus periandrae TaxID=1761741 RepID=UPI0023DD9455|nr:extracellular solute-binding protein [Paenibacillus periandrae]
MALAGCGAENQGGKNDGAASGNAPNGSSTTASKDEKVTLTFWDDKAVPNRTPFYQEMFKKCEEKNPNIHVEYVGVPQQSFKQKFDVAIASNDTPDIGAVANNYVSDFTAKGALLALDPYFDKWADKTR